MKDLKEPLLIILVLFLLFGFAYGPLKNIALQQQNLQRNAKTSSPISAISASSQSQSDLQYSSNKSVAEAIKNAEDQIKKLQKSATDAGIAGQTHSPYYSKVRLSWLSGRADINPDNQYFVLSINLKKEESLNITGWYLQSSLTGYYTIIGGASLLPFPFTRADSDIILQQGDRVILTKGFSSIGISFRTNKCTGFFSENRAFNPSLSLECPLPRDEKLPLFSNDLDRHEECVKIIERLPRCQTINSEFIRKLPDTVTESCKTYLTTKINYNTCVANHFSDTSFPGNEYRVFFNKFGPLWRTSHDTIGLYDENGLLVSSVSW